MVSGQFNTIQSEECRLLVMARGARAPATSSTAPASASSGSSGAPPALRYTQTGAGCAFSSAASRRPKWKGTSGRSKSHATGRSGCSSARLRPEVATTMREAPGSRAASRTRSRRAATRPPCTQRSTGPGPSLPQKIKTVVIGNKTWGTRPKAVPHALISFHGREAGAASTDLRINQPKTAVLAAVEHVDAVVVRIVKDEELVVAEQLHLLDGFRLVHRGEREALAPHDHARRFDRGGFFFHFFGRDHRFHPGPVAAAADMFAPVALDLPLHFVQHRVHRGVNIVLALFGAEHGAAGGQGELRHKAIGRRAHAFDLGQFHPRLVNRGQVAVELAHLLFDVLLQAGRDVEVAPLNRHTDCRRDLL